MTNLSTLSLVPVINSTATYHALNDFAHIAYIGGAPVVLAANPKTGVKTLEQFVSYANSTGKAFTFASSGVGSDGHLMGEAIASSTKVKTEHVPYKATAQALTDIVAGHVPFSTFTLSSTAPFIRANSLNGIVVTSPDRMPDFPDLPTFKELGLPELVGTTWFSLSGPPGLPKDIVDKLNREVVIATHTPEIQARFRRDGFIAQRMTAAEFTKFVAEENERWRVVVERAGLLGSAR
jgi:tripartite-type tricarboxylate transporter receptor subunit TctC